MAVATSVTQHRVFCGVCRYKWAKGCCRMRWRQPSNNGSASGAETAAQQGPYECTSWVHPELGWPTELPIGDPVSGLSWEHNGVDSGSYNLTSPEEMGLDVHPPDLGNSA